LELVVEVKSDAVRLKELEMLTREKELDMQMKLEREKMERDTEIEGMKMQMEREKISSKCLASRKRSFFLIFLGMGLS
jgi:hypothetical protein